MPNSETNGQRFSVRENFSWVPAWRGTPPNARSSRRQVRQDQQLTGRGMGRATGGKTCGSRSGRRTPGGYACRTRNLCRLDDILSLLKETRVCSISLTCSTGFRSAPVADGARRRKSANSSPLEMPSHTTRAALGKGSRSAQRHPSGGLTTARRRSSLVCRSRCRPCFARRGRFYCCPR